MDENGWEARMAARAAQRARDAPRPVDPVWRDIWAGVPGVETMTLGEAVERDRAYAEYGPIACACIGGPWCCQLSFPQVQRLKWAAHVVARLLVDTFTPTATTTTEDRS